MIDTWSYPPEPAPPAPRREDDSPPPARREPPPPVVSADPPQALSQADIATALTETLARRMKPRRKPPRDLHASTATWMFLTGVALVLLAVTLFTPADITPWVVGLGAAQVVLGYGWIVALTSGRNPRRGLACAVPPLTLYYLGQWKYAKFRPLRFATTGAVLVAVGLFAPQLAPTTRSWAGARGTGAQTPRPADPAELSRLDQLRSYRERKAYDKLIELLRVLNRTDAGESVDAKDRPALATEIRSLCDHQDSGVKVAAMAAYARWGGDDARDVCLAALAPDRPEEETGRALELLPQWKDTPAAPRIAQNTAALIGRDVRITRKATVALEQIGGPAAERAALNLLGRTDDRTTKLIALEILGKVGGDEAVKVLAGYANTSVDLEIRAKSLDTLEAIRTRPRKK